MTKEVQNRAQVQSAQREMQTLAEVFCKHESKHWWTNTHTVMNMSVLHANKQAMVDWHSLW